MLFLTSNLKWHLLRIVLSLRSDTQDFSRNSVFSRDELPLQHAFPSCLIYKTEPRAMPVVHRLALFYFQMSFVTFLTRMATIRDILYSKIIFKKQQTAGH